MKIKANTLLTRQYVELQAEGIEYCETATFGGKRFFRFDEIEAVLFGTHLLAFQVGTETFAIPIDSTKADHRTFAARLASQAKWTVKES